MAHVSEFLEFPSFHSGNSLPLLYEAANIPIILLAIIWRLLHITLFDVSKTDLAKIR